MEKNAVIKTWLPVLLAALLVVLVFATGVLDRQKTWPEMVYLNLRFPQGTSLSARGGEGYGVMNTGPGFDLPVGTYRLKWIIDTDGENRIRLRAQNGARIVPEELTVSPGMWGEEAYFTVLDPADGVQIQTVFESGTAIDAIDFRLYSPMYRDSAFTFAFSMAALCVLWLAYRQGWLTSERRALLLITGFAVLLASAPSLKDNLTVVYDTGFHMARIQNLADAFLSGQFPGRAGGFTYNGYGAVTSVFYPDILLYPFALILAAGASIQYVIHLFEIAINAAAAWTMYVCARRIFGDRGVATCASVLYTLAIYRITDVYVRGAFGEALAMSLLPLFLLGLWEAVFGDPTRWRLLAVSAACICLSHILSTLMCGLLALGVALVFIVRIVREGRLTSLVKAAAVAGLLCMFWIVPFVMYSADGIGAQVLRKPMSDRALAPAQLLLWGEGDMPVDPLDTSLSPLPVEIGLPLLLGTLLLLCLFVQQEDRDDRDMGFAMLFALAGGIAALMTTTLFPWSYASMLTRGLSDYIQFPYRFLMFADALLAMAAAYGYVRFARSRVDAGVMAALVMAAVMALPTLSAQTNINAFLEYGQGTHTSITYPEYQIPGTDVKDIDDRTWHAEGDVTVTEYEKNGTHVTAQIDAREDASLTLPMFGFRGYAAEVDGQRLDWTLCENNRLQVVIPAGTSGMLHVWCEGEAVWHIGDAISLTAALALTAKTLLKRRKMNGEKRSFKAHEMIS